MSLVVREEEREKEGGREKVEAEGERQTGGRQSETVLATEFWELLYTHTHTHALKVCK